LWRTRGTPGDDCEDHHHIWHSRHFLSAQRSG
jgi:hypothetical protein